jgi:hypothetical protein
MRSELRTFAVATVLAAWLVSGGACSGGASEGGTGGSGAGGMQTASGGAGGGAKENSCTGPVTEAQAAAVCAQAPAGSSVFLIVDADCGTTIFSSDDLHPVVAPVSPSLVGPDGGRHDAGGPAGDAGLADAGGGPDADLADAGLPSIGALVVGVAGAGEIELHNRAGIPAGPQPLVPAAPPALFPAGAGTSVRVAVPRNFDLTSGTTVICFAQSGDIDVTLPSSLSGPGAAASFTAHCQPYTADGGAPSKDAGVGNPPAKNLVGCFRS